MLLILPQVFVTGAAFNSGSAAAEQSCFVCQFPELICKSVFAVSHAFLLRPVPITRFLGNSVQVDVCLALALRITCVTRPRTSRDGLVAPASASLLKMGADGRD